MENLSLKSKIKNAAYPFIFFIILLLLWEAVARLGLLPEFILPAPSEIVLSLVSDFNIMYLHILVTVYETVTGFLISVILAVALAVIMDTALGIRRTIFPLVVISQTIPVIILAPLFIIWFGYGYLPKIIIVILICFFPVNISLLSSLTSTNREFVNLLRSMGAGKLQIYRFVKIPSAMPGLFSGLKIAATYSITGATIAEWVGGQNGLGVYMIRARHSFATDKVFASIIVVVILSIALLKFIEMIENKVLPWQKINENRYA
jgi:ABC-type nitrate/sulfonate/bicarbonate transport system permease component